MGCADINPVCEAVSDNKLPQKHQEVSLTQNHITKIEEHFKLYNAFILYSHSTSVNTGPKSVGFNLAQFDGFIWLPAYQR